MENLSDYVLKPTFSKSFGTGWKVMMDNFLRLFLIIIVMAVLTGPYKLLDFKFEGDDFKNIPWNWHENADALFNMASLGVVAAFLGFMALLYALLVAPVFEFGSDMMFVQAVRKQKPDFELFIRGFWQNYLSIVLANLLVFALVVIGLFALIIPGIIVACRLAFVSYIVMDKKLDPIEAVELSWRMTKGHGWTIFFMGFVSFFIIIFGIVLLIVGVIPAIMWVCSSFATLYQSVLLEKEPAPEVVTA
jgi:uncharacterized membrane protein